MNLIAYFDTNGAGNPYFKQIYHSIFNKLVDNYPEHNIKHKQPNYDGDYISPSAPGSYSMFTLYNEDNKKTIVMTFWDRSMDILTMSNALGWDNYDIVQLIGGLGMYKTSKQIKEEYNIDHYTYQYPLGMPNSYQYVDELKKDYNPKNKIQKAIFIGLLYDVRKELASYMVNHPLIDIFSENDGFHGKLYYEKMSEYKMVISFNGNGELAMRDFEAMGLCLPVVRSEMLTQFHQPLIPDYHYLKSSYPCSEACRFYQGKDIREVAQLYIDVVESNINNDDKLSFIANNGNTYYNRYCKPEHIINLYFDIINLNKLN